MPSMFDTLDKMYREGLKEIKPIIEVPKKCIDKTTDMKIYKRQYYLQNIEIYRERNAKYRQRKYKESTLDWLLEQEILNGTE